MAVSCAVFEIKFYYKLPSSLNYQMCKNIAEEQPSGLAATVLQTTDDRRTAHAIRRT